MGSPLAEVLNEHEVGVVGGVEAVLEQTGALGDSALAPRRCLPADAGILDSVDDIRAPIRRVGAQRR